MKRSGTHSDTQLVPSEQPQDKRLPAETEPTGFLAHYSSLPHSEGMGVMTTLDLTVRANVLALQEALLGESPSLWDLPHGTTVRVSDLSAHYAEWVDNNGVEHKGPMVTLHGPDGVFHTGSQYAFRSLQLIQASEGPPPWNPPLKLIPVQHKSSRTGNVRQSILQAE